MPQRCWGRGRKETDLIYEGIATLYDLAVEPLQDGKETDLIYEGIATCITGLAICKRLQEKKLT